MRQFIIGIGSQRAGSTLLHQVLERGTSIFMHPVKELHYYDTLFNVRSARLLKQFSMRSLNREWDRLIDADEFDYVDKRYKCYIRANKMLWMRQLHDFEYHDLYRPVLADHSRFGEITPEYMALPEAGIAKMRTDIGPDARIILIARHPVRRLASAFKLLRLYGGGSYDMQHFGEDFDRALDSMPDWLSHQDDLSDYEGATSRFSRYFNHILVLSYDQLVGNPERTHAQLEDFLGLTVDRAQYLQLLSQNVNAIGETGQLKQATERRLLQRYERSIGFLDARFGQGACVL